jgi:hypothetical protein
MRRPYLIGMALPAISILLSFLCADSSSKTASPYSSRHRECFFRSCIVASIEVNCMQVNLATEFKCVITCGQVELSFIHNT